MAKTVAEDDCLAPRLYHEIVYTGPNPLKVYGAIKGILKKTLYVETKDIWEREFRWMPDSDPAEFFIRIFTKKDLDTWSEVTVEVIMHGWQPLTPNKKGSIRVRIGGILSTKIPDETFIQRTPIYRALVWLYLFYFYFKTRRESHLQWCKDKLDTLRDEVEKILKVGKYAIKGG